MNLRAIEAKDIDDIIKIHGKHFDFPLPRLKDKNNLIVYVLEEDGKIISIMILKQILELIAITDLSVSPRTRLQALWRGLKFAISVAKNFQFNQIHVFATDKGWVDIMKKHAGFNTCKGESIYLSVREGD